MIAPSVLDSDPVAARHQAAVLGSNLDTFQTPHTATPHEVATSSVTPQSAGVVSATSDPLQVINTNRTASPNSPNLTGVTGDAGTMATGRNTYKIRNQTNTTAGNRTRRDSIEGAPDVVLTLSGSGYELSDEPISSTAPTSAAPSVIVPLGTSTAVPDDSIVPSSQQSLEEVLTIPAPTSAAPSVIVPLDTSTAAPDDSIVPSSQQSLEEVLTIPTETGASFFNASLPGKATLPLSQTLPGGSSINAKHCGSSRFAPRIIPNYQINRSDFPSWFHESRRLDAVLNVEAGGLWEKLIKLWLQQERKLKFGLDPTVVSTTFHNPCFIP